MPTTVRAAIWLYVCAVLLNFFVNGYFGPTNGSDPIALVLVAKGFFLLLALPILAFQGFLLFKISKGRSWARYALLIYVLFILWQAWPTFRLAMTLGGAWLMLVPQLGQLIAVGLLFTRGANRWFGAGFAAGRIQGHSTSSTSVATPEQRSSSREILLVSLVTAAIFVSAVIAVALVALVNAGRSDSRYLKPGDPKYPVEVAQPTRVIPLIVTGRDSADMKFLVGYTTDEALCKYHLGLGGGDFAYTLDFPVAMTQTTDGTRGSIVIDRFQAGHCGWHFAGVSYGMVDGPKNALALPNAGAATRLDDPQPTREFWCYRVTYQEKPVHECEELTSLRTPNAVRAVSPEFLAGFTHVQLSESRSLRMTPQTAAVHVQVHDLNEIPGALVPVGDEVAQAARAGAAKAALEQTSEYKAYQCVHDENFRYVQSHQQLGDTATQTKVLADIKRECRKTNGLPPEESPQ